MIKSILTAVCLLLPARLIYRRSVHMYQLCSYQNMSYKKYLQENRAETLAARRYVPLIIIMLGVFFAQSVEILGAGFFALINPARTAKKPLVRTARVKRLTVTWGLLYAIACLPCFIFKNSFAAFIPAVFVLATPYLIMLAALINRPVEKAISDHYINDAKRILRSMPGLKIIGITGSYGKTSTKYFLERLLSVKYSVYMTPGNFNTTLGVTRAIREGLRPTHDIFLCEMGARHVGDITELCELVHPDMGVVTSIGPQHLETFGSQENITAEKLELYRAVRDKDGAFLNIDSPIIASDSYDGNVTLYGTGLGADYRGDDVTVGPFGSSFTVTGPDGESCKFTTRLLGRANVQNIIGAVAVACRLGIPMKSLVPAVAGLESVPHRLQLLSAGGGTWFIDDAYNSNPEGAKTALETLSLCDNMTRVLLTPGMVELGEREGELNKEMGAYAADKCDFAVLVDKKRGPFIRDGLLEAGFPEDKIFLTDAFQKGLDKARSLSGDKMILLLNDLPDHY